MREQTYVKFNGTVVNGETQEFAALSYPRTLQVVTLVAGKVPISDCTVILQLDGVAQAQTYTLGAGQKRVPVTVTGGLGIDAGVIPTVVIDDNGPEGCGAEDLAVWIESEVLPQEGEDPNWVVPTSADLQSRISAPEFAAFTSSVIQGTQADPIPVILSDRVQQFRSIASRWSKLGPAGTLPSSLKTDFLVLCKDDLFARVATLRTFRDAIKTEVETANKHLEMLAAGKWPVEPPAVELYPQPTPGAKWGSDTKISL